MTIGPGIHPGIPHDDYHAHPALSSTGARLLTDPSCPALFRHAMDHPEERVVTEALEFGQAYHTLAFGVGPDVVEIPADTLASNGAASTSEARQFVAEARAAGAIPLKPGKYAELLAMTAALRADPIFAAATSDGDPEVSFFWRDLYGVDCRARVDWLPKPGKRRLIVPDLKSARSAHPRTFARTAVVDHGYAQQADWYLRGLRALGYADSRAAFVFFPQEKTPPYLVQPMQLDAEAMRVGEILNDRALETYARCAESGQWPGYHDGVALVSLPGWYSQPILESM